MITDAPGISPVQGDKKCRNLNSDFIFPGIKASLCIAIFCMVTTIGEMAALSVYQIDGNPPTYVGGTFGVNDIKGKLLTAEYHAKNTITIMIQLTAVTILYHNTS